MAAPEQSPEDKVAALRRAGFDDQQAQGIVYVLSDLATQTQVENLRQDLAQLRSDLTQEIGDVRLQISNVRLEMGGLRTEIAEVRTEVHRELHNLWWKLAGVLFLQAGFIVSLIKLI